MTDWADLLQRTRAAHRTTLDSGASPASKEKLLKSRAARLAQPLSTRPESDSPHAFAILRCGQDRYAIAVGELVEVIMAPQIAFVPHAPAFVAGLMQVRSEIRPVYRLTLLLGQADAAREMPAVVLLASADSEIGLGVDAVEDIRQIPPESRAAAAVAPGYAGWMTEDLIPCLTAKTLLPEQD